MPYFPENKPLEKSIFQSSLLGFPRDFRIVSIGCVTVFQIVVKKGHCNPLNCSIYLCSNSSLNSTGYRTVIRLSECLKTNFSCWSIIALHSFIPTEEHCMFPWSSVAEEEKKGAQREEKTNCLDFFFLLFIYSSSVTPPLLPPVCFGSFCCTKG